MGLEVGGSEVVELSHMCKPQNSRCVPGLPSRLQRPTQGPREIGEEVSNFSRVCRAFDDDRAALPSRSRYRITHLMADALQNFEFLHRLPCWSRQGDTSLLKHLVRCTVVNELKNL